MSPYIFPFKRTALKRKTPLQKGVFVSKKKKVKKEQITGEPLRKMLEKKYDVAVSRFVRGSAADPHTGYVQCFTCPACLPWKDMDCGHFESRRHYATRWLLQNLRPQCKECNQRKKGNLVVYAKNLGVAVVVFLKKESKKDVPALTVPELSEQIKLYEGKFKELNLCA